MRGLKVPGLEEPGLDVDGLDGPASFGLVKGGSRQAEDGPATRGGLVAEDGPVAESSIVAEVEACGLGLICWGFTILGKRQRTFGIVSMTEAKEFKPSGDDISGSVNTDPDAMKMEMGEEEDTEESDEDTEDELDNKLEPGPVDVSIDGGEEEEDTEDELENQLEPRPADMSIDGGKVLHVEVSLEKNPDKIVDSPTHGVENNKTVHAGNVKPSVDDDDIPVPEASVKSNEGTIKKPAISDDKGSIRPDSEEGHDVKLDDSLKDRSGDETVSRNQSSSLKVEQMKEEEPKNVAKTKEGVMDVDDKIPSLASKFDVDTTGGGESGTEDEQAAFMMELDKFHKERSLDFKPPKFYGEPLNLLKLWRSVLKLGGYDKVTACKYWRQVGESFKPPKTCTTVSWTFRIFYEKALLDYERYRTSSDGSSIPGSLAVPMGAENQGSGSGRARRVAAARAMEGWHSQRVLDNGEVSDPIIKDKNLISLSKKERQLKNLGELKRKNPSSTDHAVKPARKVQKIQSETTVIDIGSPADWVKINVRETKDCYEVYALVPGLLREELLITGVLLGAAGQMPLKLVRVQSDPAGRLVISGEPENPDNPWSVTPFKKVVSLPSRIDPHQTSAVVTLHGQLIADPSHIGEDSVSS
uniref:ARID domain-containing protein n=1 Tax=Chenopodium quinoa TaxID=63459 RepID=A0A803KQE9_CHEQI